MITYHIGSCSNITSVITVGGTQFLVFILGIGKLSENGQKVNILGFADPIASVGTTQLCYHVESALDSTQMGIYSDVSVKVHVQN